MATIPLMGIAPPIANPLDQFSRLMGIKAAQQQLQTGQLQQQQLGMQNQILQKQVQDQQTMSSLLPKYVTRDSQGKVTGYDWNGFYRDAGASGVNPVMLANFQKTQADARKAQSDATEGELKNQQTILDKGFNLLEGVRGTTDPAQRQQLWRNAAPQLRQYGFPVNPDQVPDDNGLGMIEGALGMHKQVMADAASQAETFKNRQQGNEAAAKAAQLQPFTPDKLAQINGALGQEWQVLHPGQALPSVYQLPQGATKADFERINSLFQNEQRAAATQAQRDTANALHQQTVAIAQQGLEMKKALLDVNPVIAFNPQTGERELTTRSEADAKGMQGPVPVTETNIEKYRSAQAQFNDVQANLSRYRAAARQFQQQGKPNDIALINAVINDAKLGGGIHLGPVGVEIPGYSSLAEAADRVTRSLSYQNLSPAGKNLVDGYLRTMSAVPAYQKALTGVGRFNKEIVDLELRNIPDPTYAPADIDRKLQAFQENVDQGAQSIPRMPGLPTIKDVRAKFEGGQQQSGPGFQIPQPFGQPGKSFQRGLSGKAAKYGIAPLGNQ